MHNTGRDRGGTVGHVLCVLYDDPVDGYPPAYARDDIPEIERYPTARRRRRPRRSTSRPGSCSAASRGELGLRRFLEERGHRLIVTSDKDGPDSEFERELPEADVVISQPFWPAYLTAERIAKAPNLKLAITAGIGSDHVDLQAAIDARHHRRRGHVLQQHQRRRARRDADPRRSSATTSRRTRSSSTAAGTSPTASRARTTWRACRSAPSARGGSARRCCAG